MASWRTLEGENIPDIYQALETEILDAYEHGDDIIAYVGTDSQNLGKKFTSFVQCIALHRIRETGTGAGGRVFFVRHLESRYVNRNKRLLREAELSIKLTQKIEPILAKHKVSFEVHADVNSNPGPNNENKSNEVCATVFGWISGMGWVCKVKPHAFVSSIIADRHTRGLKYMSRKKRQGLRETNGV